jgi:hypothetical protein
MEKLFDTINTEWIVSEFNKATFFEKRVYNDMKVYLDDKNPTKLGRFFSEKWVKWNKTIQKIELSKTLDPDSVSKWTNLKNFILKFGDRVMLIFNYIFLEKRVMFIGNKHSSNLMSEFVYTWVDLFCPPMVGLLYRALPFITLNNLNLLDMPGYIAGTNNVLFETMNNYYDLACDVESCKLKISKEKEIEFVHPEEEKHYEIDREFIQRIISRIKAQTIYDFEIKDWFASYIQTLLDLALSDDEYLNNDENPVIHHLAELNDKRIYFFKQTNLFKIYQHIQKFMSFEVRRGISMLAIETHIRRIRLEQNIDPDILQSFFYDFYQFLMGGNHDSIIRFLHLLPRHKGGLSLLGNALFSDNKKIVEYAIACLKKIEESPIGKKYIAQINFVARIKYISSCQTE